MSSPSFDADTAAAAVMAAMLPLADTERAGQAKRYLKSDPDFLGVSVPGRRQDAQGRDSAKFPSRFSQLEASGACQRCLPVSYLGTE